jgi:hypothetical protein
MVLSHGLTAGGQQSCIGSTAEMSVASCDLNANPPPVGSTATEAVIRIANMVRVNDIFQRGEYSSGRLAVGQVTILRGCTPLAGSEQGYGQALFGLALSRRGRGARLTTQELSLGGSQMTACKSAISATVPALAIAALVAISPVTGQPAPQQQAPGMTGPGSSAQVPSQMPGGMMGGGTGTPMMGMMGQRGMMPMMGMGDHIEGRIAFLKTELKITDAQTAQWNTFADMLRANAKRMGEIRNTMMQGGMMGQGSTSLSAPDRLDRMERMMTAMLDALKATRSALGPLYAALSDEQKKTADQLIHGPMGMGRI